MLSEKTLRAELENMLETHKTMKAELQSAIDVGDKESADELSADLQELQFRIDALVWVLS